MFNSVGQYIQNDRSAIDRCAWAVTGHSGFIAVHNQFLQALNKMSVFKFEYICT